MSMRINGAGTVRGGGGGGGGDFGELSSSSSSSSSFFPSGSEELKPDPYLSHLTLHTYVHTYISFNDNMIT